MKKLHFLSIALLMAALMPSALVHAGKEKAQQPEKPATEFKAQTTCPVMGGPINKEHYADIQGQRVYFCCPGCSDKVKADPDKYFKEAAKQKIMFENVQTACPVSSEPINQDVSIYHEGRTVYFCCDNCIAEFEKDPPKYLSMMDKHEAMDKSEKSMKDCQKSEMPEKSMKGSKVPDMPEKSMGDHKGHSR
jgi:YHS domain-containing protein